MPLFCLSRSSLRGLCMRTVATGFTLIELLLVIGIVGILTALALPSFLDYKARSNDASAAADVKNSTQIISASLRN
ncbi:type IV pilin protein [Stutzerimonas frequens]|uniref:type IV pilin protein n=1 Tax=Stutzerimonas frequens TaxID=2968969 RepID=UPI003F52C0D5